MSGSFSPENPAGNAFPNSSPKPGSEPVSVSQSSHSTEVLSLPSIGTIKNSKTRRKWRGFLNSLRSIDQLVPQPGLYLWYRDRCTFTMKNALKAHIKEFLGEESYDQFVAEIKRQSNAHRQKYKRRIKDRGYILAQTREIDSDSCVVVEIPYREVSGVVNLMSMIGMSTSSISHTLGLSVETIEKFNRDLNVSLTMQSIEGHMIPSTMINLFTLLGQKMNEPISEIKLSEIVSALKFCQGWYEDKRKMDNLSIPTTAEVQEEESLKRKHALIRGDANVRSNKQQATPAGGPEVSSEAGDEVRTFRPGSSDVSRD